MTKFIHPKCILFNVYAVPPLPIALVFLFMYLPAYMYTYTCPRALTNVTGVKSTTAVLGFTKYSWRE